MPANKKPKSFEHWTLLKPKDTDPVTKYVRVLLPCIELISKDQYACNFCNKVLAENVTHFKKHLKGCKTYIEKTIMHTIQGHNPFVSGIAKPSQRNQTTINFPRLSPSQKEELDFQAAMWCFLDNMPFTVFDSSVHRQFLQSLNPAYKPPSRKMISGQLLDKAYSVVKRRTDDAISAIPNINVSTDESSNIRGTRVCNISVHSESGSYHYISEDIRVLRMNAVANADWLRNHLLKLSNNNST